MVSFADWLWDFVVWGDETLDTAGCCFKGRCRRESQGVVGYDLRTPGILTRGGSSTYFRDRNEAGAEADGVRSSFIPSSAAKRCRMDDAQASILRRR